MLSERIRNAASVIRNYSEYDAPERDEILNIVCGLLDDFADDAAALEQSVVSREARTGVVIPFPDRCTDRDNAQGGQPDDAA